MIRCAQILFIDSDYRKACIPILQKLSCMQPSSRTIAQELFKLKLMHEECQLDYVSNIEDPFVSADDIVEQWKLNKEEQLLDQSRAKHKFAVLTRDIRKEVKTVGIERLRYQYQTSYLCEWFLIKFMQSQTRQSIYWSTSYHNREFVSARLNRNTFGTEAKHSYNSIAKQATKDRARNRDAKGKDRLLRPVENRAKGFFCGSIETIENFRIVRLKYAPLWDDQGLALTKRKMGLRNDCRKWQKYLL
jgi:hypothetical protein